MCDLKTLKPNMSYSPSFDKRGKDLPNKKGISHVGKLHHVLFFGVTTQRILATMGSDESVFWANAKIAFE